MHTYILYAWRYTIAVWMAKPLKTYVLFIFSFSETISFCSKSSKSWSRFRVPPFYWIIYQTVTAQSAAFNNRIVQWVILLFHKNAYFSFFYSENRNSQCIKKRTKLSISIFDCRKYPQLVGADNDVKGKKKRAGKKR